MEYILEVSNDAAFTSIAARFFQGETLPDTTVAPDYSFPNSRTYHWRARTVHDRGADLSDRSPARTFKTPVPTEAGGGGSGTAEAARAGSTGGGSTSGAAPAEEAARTPLPATAAKARISPSASKPGIPVPSSRCSLDQRKRDMQFLRDRLIEHAACKGLTVGLNLKCGGPEISNDFITFFTLGRWVGVDIASGYDDTGSTLSMMWFQHGASTNWGYPPHKPYGPVNCN